MATRIYPTLALIPPSVRAWLTDDRKIFLVVGGLLFIAVALTFLTVRYWRLTRPVKAARTSAAGRHASEPFVAPPEAVPHPPERVTRRAVAGADHRGADQDWQPRGTGEHERIEVVKAKSARPSRDGRRVVLERPTADH